MNIEEILQALGKQPVLILPVTQLPKLLAATETVAEEQRQPYGPARLLRCGPALMIQEVTGRKELALRSVPSEEAGRQFLAERLALYDKMWDGCGCKIDYYR